MKCHQTMKQVTLLTLLVPNGFRTTWSTSYMIVLRIMRLKIKLVKILMLTRILMRSIQERSTITRIYVRSMNNAKIYTEQER
jgi:hypothetical protein